MYRRTPTSLYEEKSLLVETWKDCGSDNSTRANAHGHMFHCAAAVQKRQWDPWTAKYGSFLSEPDLKLQAHWGNSKKCEGNASSERSSDAKRKHAFSTKKTKEGGDAERGVGATRSMEEVGGLSIWWNSRACCIMYAQIICDGSGSWRFSLPKKMRHRKRPYQRARDCCNWKISCGTMGAL